MNLILNSDSYKASHFALTPAGTQNMYYYISSRYSNLPGVDKYPLLGSTYLAKVFQENPITNEDLEEAQDLLGPHGLPCNVKGWRKVIDNWGGIPPIKVDTVPEGTILKPGQVAATVQNLAQDYDLQMAGYFETMILRGLWYASTVGAISLRLRELIQESLARSSDLEPSAAEGMLVDFGSRGVSSLESSMLGGLGHQAVFNVSDNLPAMKMIKDYYGDRDVSFSIPATEHSIVTSWGEGLQAEAMCLRNMIRMYGSKKDNKAGAFAFVSDSTDLLSFVSEVICGSLFDDIDKMENTLVVRPDSGDPCQTVPEVLRILEATYGSTVNSKGFRVLNPKVRVIQGDSVGLDTLERILSAIEAAGFSACNVVYGSGGGILQKVCRDDLGWAMKASSITSVTKGEYSVCKNPITDPQKASLRGRVYPRPDGTTGREGDGTPNALMDWRCYSTLAQIRKRVNQG